MPTINNFYNITNQHNRVGADIIRPRNPDDFIDTHYTNYILSEAKQAPQSRLAPSQLPLQGSLIDSTINSNFLYTIPLLKKYKNSRNSNPVAAVSFY